MVRNGLLQRCAIWGIALMLIGALAAPSAAQVLRTQMTVSGLIDANLNNAFVNESVRFDINFGAFTALDLHPRFIIRAEWDFGDGTTMTTANLEAVSHTYAQAGVYTARVRVVTPLTIYLASDVVSVGTGSFNPNTASVIVASSLLIPFDLNDDNILNDFEFIELSRAWITGAFSHDVYFIGVDLWLRGAPISSAQQPVRTSSATGFRPTATAHAGGVTFSAQGAQQLGVRVYDADGRVVFSQRASGNRLVWNLSGAQGVQRANGIYFYVLEALGSDGKLVTSKPIAFQVLR